MKEHKNVVTKEIILKKKLLGLFLVASLALAPSLSSADQLVDIAQKAGYKEATETYRPKSSLLIDANTGDILWQDNIDEVRDPASMSKDVYKRQIQTTNIKSLVVDVLSKN